MKTIQFKVNEHIYNLPVTLVALHKTMYYANKEKTPEVDKDFALELSDPEGLIDWFQNNMMWEDFSQYLLSDVDTELEPVDWVNLRFEISSI